jgi:hypothetical protein
LEAIVVARPCSACVHPQRVEIEKKRIAGAPFRRIAALGGFSETSARRHFEEHVPAAMANFPAFWLSEMSREAAASAARRSDSIPFAQEASR